MFHTLRRRGQARAAGACTESGEQDPERRSAGHRPIVGPAGRTANGDLAKSACGAGTLARVPAYFVDGRTGAGLTVIEGGVRGTAEWLVLPGWR
jgi:hypothetical protein